MHPQKRMVRSTNCAKNYCQITNYSIEVAALFYTVTGETFKNTYKCSLDNRYLLYLFISINSYPKHSSLVKVNVENQI